MNFWKALVKHTYVRRDIFLSKASEYKIPLTYNYRVLLLSLAKYDNHEDNHLQDSLKNILRNFYCIVKDNYVIVILNEDLSEYTVSTLNDFLFKNHIYAILSSKIIDLYELDVIIGNLIKLFDYLVKVKDEYCLKYEEDVYEELNKNLPNVGDIISTVDGTGEILSTNVLFGVQSIHMKEDGLTGMYYDYALAAPVLAGADKKEEMEVLILGMGSGTYAGQCRKYFPQAKVEGVEIDQKITDLAREYFELPEDVKVFTYDGRAYLKGTRKKYDVIMVDAYQDITIPFQMSSAEFFLEVKNHLKADGVMVVNMNMKSQKEGNINEYLSDTISSVFPCVYTVDVAGSTNRELFAFSDTSALSNLSNTGQMNQALKDHLKNVQAQLTKYSKGDRILTDDKAPVELLGMRVIDEIIQEELGIYKKLFKEKGMKGVLEEGF